MGGRAKIKNYSESEEFVVDEHFFFEETPWCDYVQIISTLEEIQHHKIGSVKYSILFSGIVDLPRPQCRSYCYMLQ